MYKIMPPKILKPKINYSGNDIYLPEQITTEFDEATQENIPITTGEPALKGMKTPAFAGRKQYRGRWTTTYKKYVATYKNYADFTIPLEADSAGNVLTVKDRAAPLQKFRNNKVKSSLVPKKDFAFRKGVIRQAPTKTETFTYKHGGAQSITTALKAFLNGSTSRIVIEVPNLINAEVQLTGDYNKQDQHTLFRIFYVTSDVNIFDENPRDNQSYRINIYFMDRLNYVPKQNEQVFANSLDNDCWAQAPMAFLNNNPTEKNKGKLKHLQKLIKKYPEGLPQNKIQDTLCNRTLGFGVEVFTPTGKNILSVRPKDTSKGYKVFRFMNTSYNHIEYTELYDKDRDIIEVDGSAEMAKIFESRGDKPMIYKKSRRIQGGDTIAWVAFDNKKYVLIDPLEEKRKEWLKRNNIKNLYDANDDKNVVAFINEATYVNGSHFINYMSQEDVEEQDVKQAYTAFKYADEYQHYRFPENCITDFHECEGQNTLDVIQKIGWTQIENVTGGTGYAFIDEIINLKEWGVYPNPELMCLYNLGFRFNCIYTAWTLENRDIDFDNEMEEIIHKDFKKQKEYALIAGYTLQYAKTKTVVFRYEEEPTQEWLENINYFDPTIFATFHNKQQKEIVFQKKIEKIVSSNHIGSYITAYVRNIMYKQLVKLANEGLNESNIHGVRSDAIKLQKGYGYLFDEKVFKKKEEKDDKPVCLIPDNMKDYHNFKDTSVDWNVSPWSDYGKYVVCIGAGGTGKTYSLAMNEGYCFPSLCVPTNKLRATKEEEFKNSKNLNVWTHHQSLGLKMTVIKDGKKAEVDCINKLKFKSWCGNLYIDEITMVSNRDIETAIKSLNEHYKGRVWIMGDWNIDSGMVYQLKAMDETHFKQELIMDLKPQVKLFNTNYRVKDDEIFKNKLVKVRSLMEDNYHNEKIILPELNEHIITCLFPQQVISASDAIKMYGDNDMLISSTHERVDYFNTELSKKRDFHSQSGVVGGGTPLKKEKYIITAGNENLQLYKGQIYHIDDKIQKYPYKKLAYATTIHQVQGETFANRLFIDTFRIFEWGMLYTAISRLKTEKNVYLIT